MKRYFLVSDQIESTADYHAIEGEEIVMTKDELNVLQYVGGFVSHSLLKKFENKRYAKFLECLGDMAVYSM